MSEAKTDQPKKENLCGSPIPGPTPDGYFCEYFREDAGSEWQLVDAQTPSNNYYCTVPPAFLYGTRIYLHPCDMSSPLEQEASCKAACYATYKLQGGKILPIDAASTGKDVGAPLDLIKYSEGRKGFSFVIAVEFHCKPYGRGVYEFSCGAFTRVDQTPPPGSCPKDLIGYSNCNPGFYVLFALKFPRETPEEAAMVG